MNKYDYIKELANKATKGNWIAEGAWVENDDEFLPDIVITNENRHSDLDSYEQQCIDAKYIAAVEPKVILEIIEERQQLIKERQQLIKQLDYCISMSHKNNT